MSLGLKASGWLGASGFGTDFLIVRLFFFKVWFSGCIRGCSGRAL